MIKQYVLSEAEVTKVNDRLYELRRIAMLSRASGDDESNREYYLRAKGFEEALKVLGLRDEGK